jgi:hypothetical protein
MDRYYSNTTNKRTTRNQELYKTIYEDSEYSNIEGIATIDKSNEIDITKIKNMLKNRDDFQSKREFKSYVPKEDTTGYETFEQGEDRVYDIRDILNKAKENKEEQKYHNLDQTNIDILKELKLKPKETKPQDDLSTMVDTITNTSKLNKLSDHELGLDMFEDLKSNDNTIVSDKTSIRSILEEAKKQEQNNQETQTNLDTSFFTSSLSFSQDDFEQINELKKNVKKNNTLIKVLIFIVILAITVGIIVLVFNLLK